MGNNEPLSASSNFIMGEPYREVWSSSIRNFIIEGAKARYPKLKKDQYLVVKEPNGSIGASLIMEAVPNSRLIFLIRDSRDVVASQLDANRKGSWGSQRGVKNEWEYDTVEKLNYHTRCLAQNYLREVSQAKKAFDEHGSYKSLIRYEDLRYDTFNVLKNTYSALAIEVDKVELKAAIEKHSWDRIPEHDKGAGKFFRKAQYGGWKDDLSPEQVRIIEEITGPILREFY